jgi:hypothetical protein
MKEEFYPTRGQLRFLGVLTSLDLIISNTGNNSPVNILTTIAGAIAFFLFGVSVKVTKK